MNYFSLRKREPEPVDEDLDEEEPDAAEEPAVEEQPAEPTGPLSALKAGLLGPGAWIAARAGTSASWSVHVLSLWAVAFYGGIVAAVLVVVWLLAFAAFIPREYLEQWAAWFERSERPPAGAEPEAPADPRHALARWLLQLMGDRPGIHLRELYPAMRNLPGQEARTDAELRDLLKGFGVRVSRSVRIGRLAGRSGVYRRHVEALLPSRGERPVERGGDAGQGADSPPLSGVGEGV